MSEAGLDALVRGRSWLALGLGILGLALCVFGWFLDPQQFYISYLFAELVWVGVALGCMAFLMIHYLTGGAWGWPVRRFFEASAADFAAAGIAFYSCLLWDSPSLSVGDAGAHCRQRNPAAASSLP